MENTVVWFEIPAKNLDRAIKFYSEVMQIELQQMPHGPLKMAFFPYAPGKVSGALVEGEGYIPSDKGTLVYLYAGDDLAISLSRVEKSGGKVIQNKMSIGEHGFIGIFIDTEGNRVAFHSMK